MELIKSAMTKIIHLDTITKNNIPPESVLNAAIEQDVKNCVVIGYDKYDELYFASSKGDVKEILYLLESAKIQIMTGE